MAEKDDKGNGEIKPQPGQSLEDALKAKLRDMEEEVANEREERKKANSEAAEQRKARKAAEEKAREVEEHGRRESQKTLEEQGRYKDLFEGEQRRSAERGHEIEDLIKKVKERDDRLEDVLSKLTRHEKREAERIEARFSKLPEDFRKLYADRTPPEKELAVDAFERASGTARGPGHAPIPPSSLGPTGNFVREEDLEEMTQAEREKYFKSPEFKRAVQEGRFLRKGQPGPR